MKIYISTDFEGLPQTTHWNEVTRSKPDFSPFQDIMIEKLNASCKALNDNGVDEIWVNDAHGVGRGYLSDQLPPNVTLIRGISGHPFGIMQNIDKTFDAAILLGAHSGAGMNYSNLEHTLNDETISMIKINDLIASEFLLSLYTAEYVGVPMIFVGGDKGICQFINNHFPSIKTVATKECLGNSTISRQSSKINELIENEVAASIKTDLKQFRTDLPKDFNVELKYIHHYDAYKYSFYPGITMVDETTLRFQSNDFFEVLRMINFIV